MLNLTLCDFLSLSVICKQWFKEINIIITKLTIQISWPDSGQSLCDQLGISVIEVQTLFCPAKHSWLTWCYCMPIFGYTSQTESYNNIVNSFILIYDLFFDHRDNSSSDSNRSPQPEKKLKTLSEVKSDVKQSLAQKSISKTKVIPPQPKRKWL